MTTVIVYVLGGVVQDIDVDTDEVRVMVVDYDNEEEEGQPLRDFFPLVVNPVRVAQALAGVEKEEED